MVTVLIKVLVGVLTEKRLSHSGLQHFQKFLLTLYVFSDSSHLMGDDLLWIERLKVSLSWSAEQCRGRTKGTQGSILFVLVVDGPFIIFECLQPS